MGVKDEVQEQRVAVMVAHVKQMIAARDGAMPSRAEIDASKPPVTMGQIGRYGIGWAQLADLCGLPGQELERAEKLDRIRKRVKELGDKIGRPPTVDEYNADRNGAPTFNSTFHYGWAQIRVDVFGRKYRYEVPTRTTKAEEELSDADFEQVTHEPPPNLEPKLRWSMGGVMATDAYQDAYGRTVYRLR